MKFTFKAEDQDGGHITVSFEAAHISEVFERFEGFLKACGYQENSIHKMMRGDR